MKRLSLLAALAASVVTPAFAIQLPPVQVSEPSLLGLTAIAVAGLIVAYRARNRK